MKGVTVAVNIIWKQTNKKNPVKQVITIKKSLQLRLSKSVFDFI